ncbi:MAG TPA: aminoglycoside phosphotransferase family protein [Anaerolineales bacterium]|nr:aminoglycoside phosphotransferase family protein [Anaerolineales bacterium]
MDEWTTCLYALLPHPDQLLVLSSDKDAGKAILPGIRHIGRIWVPDTQTLMPLLEELTGVPVNILRYVAYYRDEEVHQSYCIYLLEPRGTMPDTDLWQPLAKILADSDIPPALKEGLARWGDEQRLLVTPERRAPWAKTGWHAKVEGWIEDQVSSSGRGNVLRIEPIKSWSISCVLKITTETGVLYFKVPRDLPLFVNEGVVLSRLAEIFPDRVPVPVALDATKGWMLLDDFGTPAGADASLDYQTNLMQDFARLQIESSRNIERLLSAGCIDRRLEKLLAQIEPLFDDEIVLQTLTPKEREKLKQVPIRLRPLLAELFALPIPVALLHGDLHAGNVVLRGNSFLYFDWTDAAISHPFFDMIHIFMEEDEARKISLQEAYLSIWEENFPKNDVRRAWVLASALYGFYHAVSYQYIVRGIEEIVRSELNFAFYFLRKLLEGIESLDTE